MSDWRAAWLRHQLAAGEAALGLRQDGATWRHITDELRLADETHARRCVALYLSADLASHSQRQAAIARGEKPAPYATERERAALCGRHAE